MEKIKRTTLRNSIEECLLLFVFSFLFSFFWQNCTHNTDATCHHHLYDNRNVRKVFNALATNKQTSQMHTHTRLKHGVNDEKRRICVYKNIGIYTGNVGGKNASKQQQVSENYNLTCTYIYIKIQREGTASSTKKGCEPDLDIRLLSSPSSSSWLPLWLNANAALSAPSYLLLRWWFCRIWISEIFLYGIGSQWHQTWRRKWEKKAVHTESNGEERNKQMKTWTCIYQYYCYSALCVYIFHLILSISTAMRFTLNLHNYYYYHRRRSQQQQQPSVPFQNIFEI